MTTKTKTPTLPAIPTPTSSELWTTQEAGDALRVSKKYMEIAIREGRIPAYSLGSLTRLDPRDVIAFGKATPYEPRTA